MIRIILATLTIALGLAGCGDRGPCHIGDCPATVNCMPVIAPENECLCSADGHAWMRDNCPDTQYLL